MRTEKSRRWAVLAAVLLLFPASSLHAQGNGEAPRAPELPGFSFIPAGVVNPGCTLQNVDDRAQGSIKLKQALWYDLWGAIPEGSIQLPPFFIGTYEVTNAQFKLYLDRVYRETHTCSGQESLEDISSKYVKFRDAGVADEWKAIYCLNAKAIYDALVEADRAAAAKAAEKNEPAPDRKWNPAWKLENPDPANTGELGRELLPKGLKLNLYRHRVPSHWYGWNRLSRLNVGREFCDITKPPTEAFVVPEDEVFKRIRALRANDFASYPVRDLAANEILAFAEWAGCHLPSEYEWERAARGDKPNTQNYPFPGKWERNKQLSIFAWDKNLACRYGPLPVDAPSVHGGDSQFGLRHMIGNVYELTRTFIDFHPLVRPRPPEPPGGIFNFALTAKGGSWGDGWQVLQISTRTGQLGSPLDLTELNRADTLGFRLVRHPVPGHDLMLHSILRMAYDRGRGAWNEPLPHAYAMSRMVGLDEIHVVAGKAPYLHVQDQAHGIAFAPLWVSGMNSNLKKKSENLWRQGRATGKDYAILGVLRSDVPLRAGRRLNPADAAALLKEREDYAKLLEAYEKQQKDKKRKRRKKKGEEEEEEIVLPEFPPAQPDEFEKITEKNRAAVGLWRESTLAPGEWLVIYWYGFIGLANKTRLMPPDAILFLNPRKDIQRIRKPAERAQIALDVPSDKLTLTFRVEEEPDLKKPQKPPAQQDSEEWALCEVHPNGWPARKSGKYSWEFKVVLPFEKAALQKHNWNK